MAKYSDGDFKISESDTIDLVNKYCKKDMFKIFDLIKEKYLNLEVVPCEEEKKEPKDKIVAVDYYCMPLKISVEDSEKSYCGIRYCGKGNTVGTIRVYDEKKRQYLGTVNSSELPKLLGDKYEKYREQVFAEKEAKAKKSVKQLLKK